MKLFSKIYNCNISRALMFLHLLSLIAVYSWAFEKEIDSHNLYEQPFAFKLFVFADLPAIILTALLLKPFSLAISGATSLSLTALFFFVFLVISTFQWGIVGLLLNRLVKSLSDPNN